MFIDGGTVVLEDTLFLKGNFTYHKLLYLTAIKAANRGSATGDRVGVGGRGTAKGG